MKNVIYKGEMYEVKNRSESDKQMIAQVKLLPKVIIKRLDILYVNIKHFVIHE